MSLTPPRGIAVGGDGNWLGHMDLVQRRFGLRDDTWARVPHPEVSGGNSRVSERQQKDNLPLLSHYVVCWLCRRFAAHTTDLMRACYQHPTKPERKL
jgi:hypothetical protein